jgi:hypothetical protein
MYTLYHVTIYCQTYSLTLWADVGAAGGDARFLYGRAAAGTGLAFAAKDIGEAEVAALLAFGIHIVFIRTAAFFDAEVHNFLI